MIHQAIAESFTTCCRLAKNSVKTDCAVPLAMLVVLVGVCIPSTVLAQVPRVYGQGAAASGMGNAFAAQADNP